MSFSPDSILAAVATFSTGIMAVLAALWVGNKQVRISASLKDIQERQIQDDLKLKRQTQRLELLEHRSECIQKMRVITGAWWENATLTSEQWQELQSVLWDVQLLYPDEIVSDVDAALSGFMKEKLHRNRSLDYHKQGRDELAQEQMTKQFEAEDIAFKAMNGLLSRMIAHTRVFDWD